jgi:hypothetical protein
MLTIEGLSEKPHAATAASCVVTIPSGGYAAIASGNTFTVGHKVFEFRKSGSATSGNVKVDLSAKTDDAGVFDAVHAIIESEFSGKLAITALDTTSGTLATVGTGTVMNAVYPVLGLATKIVFSSTTGGKLDGATDATPAGLPDRLYTYDDSGDTCLAIYDGSAWQTVTLTEL